MKWTLFVLDFDNTYDNESDDELGVQPIALLLFFFFINLLGSIPWRFFNVKIKALSSFFNSPIDNHNVII